MRRPSIQTAAAFATLMIGSTTTTAAQAGQGTVTIDTAACPAVSEAAIRRIVGIEIGDLLAEPGAAPAGGNRLSMFCDGDGAARLEARGIGSDQRMERAFRLADFPGDAAPRALALAGVEMLAALDPAVRERIQIRQSPPAPPPPPQAAPPDRANAADSLAPVGIAISAVRRDFLGDGSAGGWGGRVDLDRGLGGPFVLGVDAEIDGARAAVTLGEARALILSAGGFGGLRASGARFAGSLAAGARVGLASFEGTPSDGSGATGGRALRPWWGPALAARGWIRAGALAFVATLEAGVVARGAQGLADGATILAVDGPWLAAGIGVRF